MKKLIPLFVIGILVISGFGISAATNDKNSNNLQIKKDFQNSMMMNRDELDQYQLEMDWFGPVGRFFLNGEYYILAQAFIPTKNILTRVEIMVGRNSTTTYDYVLSIRDDLNGTDLTSVNVAADQIVIENFSWVEFDFEDITVAPGETYYIVSSTQDEPENWYACGMKIGDVYLNGTVFYTIDYGENWEEEPDGDMTFKTYGIDNSPPATPIIEGPSSGKPGTSYTYTFITGLDPDGDDVSYYIEWGDNTSSGWTGFIPSGPPGYSESHSWTLKGTYTISGAK